MLPNSFPPLPLVMLAVGEVCETVGPASAGVGL